jgi:hypothetical protein
VTTGTCTEYTIGFAPATPIRSVSKTGRRERHVGDMKKKRDLGIAQPLVGARRTRPEEEIFASAWPAGSIMESLKMTASRSRG